MSMAKNEVVFNDMWGTVWGAWPIVPAKGYKAPYEAFQRDKYNRVKLVECPGMVDYQNQGWIMTAWSDIHVHFDGENTLMYYGTEKGETWPKAVEAKEIPEGCPYGKDFKPMQANAMGPEIADGVSTNSYNGKPLVPMHITSPWAVIAPGVSLMAMPPFYHSNIFDDFFIYPGIIDYNGSFSTLNVIIGVRKPGEYIIKAGTPLLHLIPTVKGNWKGYVQHDPAGVSYYKGNISKLKQWYRRLVQGKASYTIERLTK